MTTTYLGRALDAARAPEQMRDVGDHNAACNRAYYAIFYAALGLLEQEGNQSPGKTHSSLLRKFSERFVLSGLASRDGGRALAVTQNLRSKADYSVTGASEQDAADAMAAMQMFLEFAQPRLALRPGATNG